MAPSSTSSDPQKFILNLVESPDRSGWVLGKWSWICVCKLFIFFLFPIKVIFFMWVAVTTDDVVCCADLKSLWHTSVTAACRNEIHIFDITWDDGVESCQKTSCEAAYFQGRKKQKFEPCLCFFSILILLIIKTTESETRTRSPFRFRLKIL